MTAQTSITKRWFRLLTFRATGEDFESLGRRDFAWGLIACWIVGMGRYWDDPRATWLQHLGVGSVIYVFALAMVMWLIIKPVAPNEVSYIGFLGFIVMTSPPAILYAIPVERWMTLEEANSANLWFLVVVALWRLALWVWYLSRHCQLSGWRIFVATSMPVTTIFLALVSLNLHHVVFNIMGGIREADKTSQDAAYAMLNLLMILSVPICAVAVCAWIGIAFGNLSSSSGET